MCELLIIRTEPTILYTFSYQFVNIFAHIIWANIYAHVCIPLIKKIKRPKKRQPIKKYLAKYLQFKEDE